MRLRQICLVAEDLKSSLETLADLLASPVIYRDPEVSIFGLENGLVMTGGDFVEVVSPLAQASDTAAWATSCTLREQFLHGYFSMCRCQPTDCTYNRQWRTRCF